MVFGYEPFAALEGFIDLRRDVVAALGPNRKPLIIAIDGPMGAGKTALSGWLGWQLAMPSLHLDMFLKGNGRLEWSYEWISLALNRMSFNRPLLVEGTGALDALEAAGYSADFVVFTEDLSTVVRRKAFVDAYFRRRGLPASATFHLQYTLPEPSTLLDDPAL